jgi:hypothetical protein
LVAQGASRVLNSELPRSVVDRAFERDAASAAAEYNAQFRTDIEALLTREAVEACVSFGCYERAPLSDQNYFSFVDPSGGSSDSMTLAIGHREGDVCILDAIRERKPPFSPQDVVNEFTTLLKSYSVVTVQGDRYGGEWPREQFQKAGISYEPAAEPKSNLYRDLVPLVNSRRIDLVDHPRLINQLVSLERRTARGGRDSIDHPPGGHDDCGNVIAGLASLCGSQYRYPTDDQGQWIDNASGAEAAKAFLNARMSAHIRAYGGRRW